MRGRRGIVKPCGCRIRPLQRHLSVSVLTQLPVVILVFVIFECRLRDQQLVLVRTCPQACPRPRTALWNMS